MSSHIIGHIESASGEVSATRADGTQVVLAAGDAVFEGDVIHTGSGAAVGIVFIDDTTFSLGANASMALDELIFDPDSGSGSSAFSILEGAFVFVSGTIAETNPENMIVETPVATIGVRGTEVAGNCDDGCVITVIDGTIVITNAAGEVVLTIPNQATDVRDFDTAPSDAFLLSPEELEELLGANLVNMLQAFSNVAPEAGTAPFSGLTQGGTFRASGEPGEDGVFVATLGGGLITIEVEAETAEEAEALIAAIIETLIELITFTETDGFIPPPPPPPPENEPPIAEDNVSGGGGEGGTGDPTPGAVDEDTPGTIDVVANDSDPDGDTLTIVALTDLNDGGVFTGASDSDNSDGLSIITDLGGVVTVDASGDVTYDPAGSFDFLAAGESATDSFQYTISDGQGGTATATVTVTIDGVNDAPVVVPNAGLLLDEGATRSLQGILVSTDVDSDNSSLLYQVTVLPEHGQLEFTDDPGVAITSFTQLQLDDGEVVYVHDGTDTETDDFHFTVSDGLDTSPVQSFDIDITPVDDGTLARLDVGYFDIQDGHGDVTQAAPILAAGHTPIQIFDFNDLAGIDILFVQNPLDPADPVPFFDYSFGGDPNDGVEYLANLDAISDAVFAGMILIIHDSLVSNLVGTIDASDILPGGELFDFTGFFEFTSTQEDESGDLNLLADAEASLIGEGPGGLIDDDLLDTADPFGADDPTSFGFADVDSLDGATVLISRSDEGEIVAFSYSFGEGTVIYSTVPLGNFLVPEGELGSVLDPLLAELFTDVYAPNIIQYGAGLLLEGADKLIGTAGDETLSGTATGDLMDGLGGADTIMSFGGDDTIVWDAGDLVIDGGSGDQDMLRVAAGDADLVSFGGTLDGIELVDLVNADLNILTLSPGVVLQSDTATLEVRGDAGDSVVGDFTGAVVTPGPSSTTYTIGGATLIVDDAVDQTGIII